VEAPDRYLPPECKIPRNVDAAHAALTNLAVNPVSVKILDRHQIVPSGWGTSKVLR